VSYVALRMKRVLGVPVKRIFFTKCRKRGDDQASKDKMLLLLFTNVFEKIMRGFWMNGKRMVKYYDNNQLNDDLVGKARVLQKRACIKEREEILFLSFFTLNL
jgi:hypothetical protein